MNKKWLWYDSTHCQHSEFVLVKVTSLYIIFLSQKNFLPKHNIVETHRTPIIFIISISVITTNGIICILFQPIKEDASQLKKMLQTSIV